MGAYYPTIIEKTAQGENRYDIFTRLLKDRIIFIGGEITDETADSVVAQLLYLQNDDSEQPINLYLNSPGGSVTAGLAIYDTLQFIAPPVSTICMGQAASMAALLFASGTKGSRMILPSARVMIHQPWGGVTGQASDIRIQTKEILRIKELTIRYFAEHTGKKEDQIIRDLERDYFMSAAEAIEYGIADQILEKH